jgi:caffeoyl-CoA O-methyltransferase
MASRASDWIDTGITAYIADRARPRPDDVLAELRSETEALGDASVMQVSADQGALLTLLTRLAGASFAVEVGTFTGYSAICIARGLSEGGRLLCCDVSEDYTAIGRRAWKRAGVDDRIDLRIAPASETLQALPADQQIDVAFIDADKPGYLGYYEEILKRLRPGGLIMVDNTLWSGRVVETSEHDGDTEAIKRFNDVIAADSRVDSYILPVSDGLTLIVKR